MIRLILARHGNTFEAGQTPTQVGARTDLPLTAQGRQQGLQLAHYLASEGICPAGIYAGSLKRQIETAQIIGQHLDVKSSLHLQQPALTEIDYGSWEGLTAEEIGSRWPHEYDNWTAEARWPDAIFGSSSQQHLHHIGLWLDELRRKHKSGETIVGLTSNGIIRFFYSWQKETWQRLVQTRQMETLKVKTGHFCELQLFPDSLQVTSWNTKP